ncbi:beclin 1-associated autophagy-related key regulator isoform X2 [Leptinotarsa decemlineata]|uniref:beclin 1-associated autophagy-related key regulator isoform X2 n=1 Tax=Leptinotarsa decemlineata TaxID=7539 RepID=UPI003D306F54
MSLFLIFILKFSFGSNQVLVNFLLFKISIMAISSSDESSTPPKEFHLSTSSLSDGLMSPNKHKCPLCRKLKYVFYCRDCACNLLFRDQKESLEKQRTLRALRDNPFGFDNQIEFLHERRLKRQKLTSSIKTALQRIEMTKLALKMNKERRELNNARLLELKGSNTTRKKNLPRYESKVEEIGNYVVGRRETIQGTKQTVKEKQEELQKKVQIRVKQLFKYIFPITNVIPTLPSHHPNNSSIILNDGWEYSEYLGEPKYCIVGPTLPVSGDYSAYNKWVSCNQDVVPSSDSTSSVQLNPAFTISAGLTYTSQLVILLSYYLNIRLPCKMQYSDYCSSFMDEEQFTRRLTRLNANILYLLFLQNVNLKELKSAQTIRNLLRLVEDKFCDLGRMGPANYNYKLASTLEKPLLPHIKPGEESDSEDTDLLNSEWEAVPHVQCPEMAAGPAITQATQASGTQQTTTMASSLVNTAAAGIASIWRGFTGRYI